MSKYVENTLMPGENVIYQAKISLWSQLFLIIIGALLLFAAGIGLLFWLLAYLKYKSTELAITNKRVIAKFGLMKRSTIELNLNKIEGVRVEQSIFGRLFNYGSLIISGTGTTQEPIPYISSPLMFRNHFSGAQDAAIERAPQYA